MVQLPPGASDAPQDKPESRVKVESPPTAAVSVAVAGPLFVTVTTSRVEVFGTTTWPKSKEVALRVRPSDEDASLLGVRPHPASKKATSTAEARGKGSRLYIVTLHLDGKLRRKVSWTRNRPQSCIHIPAARSVLLVNAYPVACKMDEQSLGKDDTCPRNLKLN